MTKVFQITPESLPEIWAILQPPVVTNSPADLVAGPMKSSPDDLRRESVTAAQGTEVIGQVKSLKDE
ncbi:hypothetical protein QUA70_12435 [Microcoleus sp. LAD1_D5]|uniref:hypothetical protein n=1 Tax=unclassified Microcoleus TaxID=2642155 RepID=UPI002FD62F9C